MADPVVLCTAVCLTSLIFEIKLRMTEEPFIEFLCKT